jgi:hypothetical protein
MPETRKTPWQSYEMPPSQAVKKKYHPPSRAKIREEALHSYEGGRMKCDYCGYTFAAAYVRLVRPESWLQEPKPACRDCRESHNLFTI